jgi:hypothetical protein
MKVVEEKMPSGRRNDATRTMKSRTMPCNVSICSLSTVDKKASISTVIFATQMVTRQIKRNEDPVSPSYMNHAARRRDHLYYRDESCRRKDAERSTKRCHPNGDEPDYAVQRLSMLFEHRRPKKASVSTTIFATRMVTRHIKRNKLLAARWRLKYVRYGKTRGRKRPFLAAAP